MTIGGFGRVGGTTSWAYAAADMMHRSVGATLGGVRTIKSAPDPHRVS
jgi:Na+/H+ antiporter NhaB